MTAGPRLLAGFFSILVAVSGQDGVNGVWKAQEVAFAPWTFDLKADGTRLTGTVSQGGSNGAATTTLTAPTEIAEGRVDGPRILFHVTSPGGARVITFTGTLEGDTIAFDRTVVVQPGGDAGLNGIYGATGAGHFIARRASAQSAPSPATAPASKGTDTLRVVLLGTGTPNPDPNRSGPAVAVVAGTRAYLVDAGPGVVRRAQAAAQQMQINPLFPALIGHLFLTHLHSDHTLGYPDLIFTPAVTGRAGPLEVYGPKGTEEMTGHLLAAWKKDMDVRLNGLEHGNPNAYKVNVHEINPGVVYRDNNVTVKAFLVKHATWDQAFGYRFETGTRSIVISGDASPSPSVAEACNGCDVLLHEVYCDPPTGNAGAYYQAAHTSASEVAQIAAQAKPRLLVLYHQLFARCNEAALVEQVQRGYSGAVVSAKDFDVF